MCGWSNGQGDDLQWQLGAGPTPTKATGPVLDHTFLPAPCANSSLELSTRTCAQDYPPTPDTPLAHYAYIEASGATAGDEAYLSSPLFQPARDGFNCRLDFWFHLYGADVGYLAVDLKRNPQNLRSTYTQLWIRQNVPSPAEERYDVWKHASVPLQPDSDYDNSAVQVRFRAGVRGAQSDMALDDIRLVCSDDFTGACECDPGYLDGGDGVGCVADPNEFPPSTPAPDPPVATCLSGYSDRLVRLVCEQQQLDRPVCGQDGIDYLNPYCALCNAMTDYTVGRCGDPTPPTPVVATCPVEGNSDLNRLYQLGCYDRAPSTVCADKTDYYNKDCALCNGVDDARIVYAPCGSDTAMVGSCPASASHSAKSLCAFTTESPVCFNGSITYRSAQCATCNGIAAAEVVSGACIAPVVRQPCRDLECPVHAVCARTIADCDFEDSLCGWENQDAVDALDWSRGRNGTPTLGTGPTRDRTLNSSSGHFLFLETSKGKDGHTAVLLSPELNMTEYTPAGDGHCALTFWYHMYGADVKRLEVHVSRDAYNTSTAVWQRNATVNSGEVLHDRWLRGSVSLQGVHDMLRLAFVGVRGDGIRGDIALDDVELVCDANDFGDCKCEEGYALDASRAQCLPSLVRALQDDTASRFEFFLKLVELTGMRETLDSDGPYMVLAPTDTALGAINSTLAVLFAVPSLDAVQRLRNLVRAHVFVAQDLSAARLPATVKNIDGRLVAVARDANGTVMVGRQAVLPGVLSAVNGMVYGLSGVLGVRPSQPGFCGRARCDATYGECHLVNLNQTAAPDDACERAGKCTGVSPADVVCGSLNNGVATYRSACHAECTGATVLYDGVCQVGECRCRAPAVGSGAQCAIPTTTTPVVPTTSAPTTSTTSTTTVTISPLTVYFEGSFQELQLDQREGQNNFVRALMGATRQILGQQQHALLTATIYPGSIVAELSFSSESAKTTVSAAVAAGQLTFFYAAAPFTALAVPPVETTTATSTSTTTVPPKTTTTSSTTATVPTTSEAAVTTTPAAPMSTSTKPSASTTTNAPTTTTAAPPSTTSTKAAPSTTTAGPATTSTKAVPTTAAPVTTSSKADLSTTTDGSVTTSTKAGSTATMTKAPLTTMTKATTPDTTTATSGILTTTSAAATTTTPVKTVTTAAGETTVSTTTTAKAATTTAKTTTTATQAPSSSSSPGSSPSPSTAKNGKDKKSMVVGLAVAGAVGVIAVVLALFYVKRRRSRSVNMAAGPSEFKNPTFNQACVWAL